MAKKPETKFYARLHRELSCIPNSWWQRIDISYARGVPDYIGCVNGRFVGLEGKVRSAQATAIQKYILNCIQRAGGFSEVINEINMEEIIRELRKL